jgi:hypothetical protein
MTENKINYILIITIYVFFLRLVFLFSNCAAVSSSFGSTFFLSLKDRSCDRVLNGEIDFFTLGAGFLPLFFFIGSSTFGTSESTFVFSEIFVSSLITTFEEEFKFSSGDLRGNISFSSCKSDFGKFLLSCLIS